jgi:amino acid permease
MRTTGEQQCHGEGRQIHCKAPFFCFSFNHHHLCFVSIQETCSPSVDNMTRVSQGKTGTTTSLLKRQRE